ncbi:hypothetical protein [Kordiimonas sp. SCSIO 12610]|uniref:hypothetical protein n=1 Tax=Kordiimonas sp. SCSIO 12610 TaxID=2829597 RepID=UPI00210B1F47|nr:hypothetical protein [Kordiimonas sp. SCSIO 12610]UTW55111.1 hypothetical protein KFF44_15105 [Kordiimonas sp. SCSIO 12610]
MLFSGYSYASAQDTVPNQAAGDVRTLAVDIHLSLNRDNTPDAIAFKLTQAIQLFRSPCEEVTDFQIYSRSQNLTVLKAKCKATPLYGISVGSNGYISVYGGDGIIAGFDRRDGVIYSFGLDGNLEASDGITIDNILDETAARLQSGDDFSPVYILLFVVIVLIIIAISIVMSLGLLRRRSSRREADTQLFSRRVSKETKDQLTQESKKLIANIFKHPSGIYIVRGKSGHRRFFASLIWALSYRYFSTRLFESSPPTPIDEKADQD